jgi:4-hydroxybenzoate polyprenyltransferase
MRRTHIGHDVPTSLSKNEFPRREETAMNGIRPYLKLLRPHQWVKSGFVFVGLLFGHAWQNTLLVQNVFLAATAFALTASAVYVINDLADREKDRQHPEKRHRPLAAGTVNVTQALLLAGACLLAALMLAQAVSTWVLGILIAYTLLNIAYSMGLKHVVLLDVFIISAGFMLRILAGTLGVGIAPSHWLLLCGLMLTLFLGFAKRRAELNALQGRAGNHRRVLDDYNPALLDKLIGICAASTIVSYSLYTVSAETLALHGTTNLIYSVPFVVYGIFRYLFLLHRRGGGGDPAVALLRDAHLLTAFAAWLATVIVLFA